MVVKQYDEDSTEMYYIIQGDCIVMMVDEYKKEHIVRVLVEGNQFGEIGMVYNCARTATVITRNYNTLAKLSKP